jgi:hypothetical protein
MARKRNTRRSNSSVPRPVTIYDPFAAMQLAAARNDSVTCSGRFNNSVTIASGANASFALAPTLTYSDRLNNLGQAYQKYRIKQIVFKVQFLSLTAGIQPLMVYGVDEDLASINPPLTAAAVSAFRCSATTAGTDADSGDVLTYIPSDRKRWFYTNGAGLDARFQTEAVLWFSNPSNANVTVLVEVGFRYVFCQAGGNGNFDLSDPFRRPLTITAFPSKHTDTESDDSVIVKTPRPPPLTSVAPVGKSGRWI